ncbi:MPI1B phosphatase, partial [Amia calva]|nr:MPI1B phosphatase [Amia calva]
MGGLGSPISSGPPSPPPAALPAPPPLLQDGFSEFMETDESVTNVHMTSSMALLLSDPLMTQDMDLSTLSVCSRGGAAGGGKRLFRSPSMPERLDKAVLRRAQPPSSSSAVSASTRARTPPRSKRYRNDSSPIPEREREEDEEGWVEESRSGDACKRRCLLQKTVSLCEEELGREGAHCQLTGDFSKVCALPIVSGRHQDLKYITAETLSAVLAGQFSSLVESCVLVDCRYPYEYEGGHIKGALNLSTPEGAAHHFLHTPMAPQCPNRRLILVLHCEYSSERAPRAARFLRREDRRVNEYPALHYPELYILKGGYKDFFPQYKELCVPQSYCPMNSSDHREELLRCRSHSRSWAGQRRRHEHISRLMKL